MTRRTLRSTRLGAAVAVGVTLALLMTGCTGDPMPTPNASPTASPSPTPEGPFGDGELRIGSLVPIRTDPQLALAQVAGVELAVREINEAGGYGGAPVVTYHRDSGETLEALEASFTALVERGVDVVIGPSTLEHARALAPLAVEANVMVITPALADPAADRIDADGLLANTLPSAVHDAAGIAAQLPPRARIALIYFSDSTGKGAREHLADAVRTSDRSLVATIALTPTMRNPERVTTELERARADAIIYAGSAERPEQNTLILTALADTDLAPSLWLTSTAATAHNIEPGVLDGAYTVTPGAQPDTELAAKLRSIEPRARSLNTAAESYDAVILAALAAAVADDDGGRAIAAAIADVSGDGIPCRSWGHCLHVLQTSSAWGNNINYEGRSGPLDLDHQLRARPHSITVHTISSD